MFIGALIYGLVNAAVLVLYALGFSLTFGISGIANFAYGALYVMTGFGAWSLINTLGQPIWVSLPLAVIATSLAGGLMHRLILVRVRGMPEAEVIATFGCGLIILEGLRHFGFMGHEFSLPVIYEGGTNIGGVFLDWQRLMIILAGIGLTGGLWFFTRHTRMGRSFRALAQDERTALVFGIDSDRTAAAAMALGAGLCAAASLVILPIGNISVESGYDVLLQALAVCIVGGLGHTGGVVAAGIILGLSQTMAAMYIGSHWMMIVTLAGILVILAVRPSGLFGRQKELEERT